MIELWKARKVVLCSSLASAHSGAIQYYAGLWSEVNALRDAILMPRQKVSKLINAIEQGKLSDEEYATLKWLVEKRDREAAQMTITPVDNTIHHCSPISQTPEPPSVVYFNLENEEVMI